MNHNHIDGEWLAGASSRANINPSDLSDVVGDYAQADEAQAAHRSPSARKRTSQ